MAEITNESMIANDTNASGRTEESEPSSDNNTFGITEESEPSNSSTPCVPAAVSVGGNVECNDIRVEYQVQSYGPPQKLREAFEENQEDVKRMERRLKKSIKKHLTGFRHALTEELMDTDIDSTSVSVRTEVVSDLEPGHAPAPWSLAGNLEVLPGLNPKPQMFPRKAIFETIEKQIQENQSRNPPTALSQVVVLTGQSGTGKTELIRRYIPCYKNPNRFLNSFWITAGHAWQAANCFLQIASRMGISPVDFSGNAKSYTDVAEEVYDIICRDSSIIVFENAPRLNKKGGGWGLKPFLPKSIAKGWIKPVILVTSTRPDWQPLKSFPIHGLSSEECYELLVANGCSSSEAPGQLSANELLAACEGLPLVIQVAIKTIITKGQPAYTLEAFISEHQLTQQTRTRSSNGDPAMGRNVYTVFEMAFNKLKGHEHGDVAMVCLEMLSFLDPDAVSKRLLADLLPNHANRRVAEACKLLVSYNVIIDCIDDWKINRLTQSAARHYLNLQEQLVTTRKSTEVAIKELWTFLGSYANKISINDPHFGNVVENLLHLHEVTKEYNLTAEGLPGLEELVQKLKTSKMPYHSLVLLPHVLKVRDSVRPTYTSELPLARLKISGDSSGNVSIQPGDASASSVPELSVKVDSPPSTKPHKIRLEFPIHRGKYVELLHEKISAQDAQKSAPRNPIILTGPPGVGKTVLVRQYIENRKLEDEEVLWVSAGSPIEIKCSFLKAVSLNCSQVLCYKHKSDRDYAQHMYKNLQFRPGLIIFDDVQDFGYCQNFLPPDEGNSWANVIVVATSRIQGWSHANHIEIEGLEKGECFEMLKSQLKCENTDENRILAQKIWLSCRSLPLLVQHAISTTKYHSKIAKKNNQNKYTLEEYLLANERSLPQRRRGVFSQSDISEKTFEMYLIAFRTLAREESGSYAVLILIYMSFLTPANIPKRLIFSVFPKELHDEVTQALTLLSKYYLVTIYDDFFMMQRAVQQAMISWLDSWYGVQEEERIKKFFCLVAPCFFNSFAALSLGEADACEVIQNVAKFLEVMGRYELSKQLVSVNVNVSKLLNSFGLSAGLEIDAIVSDDLRGGDGFSLLWLPENELGSEELYKYLQEQQTNAFIEYFATENESQGSYRLPERTFRLTQEDSEVFTVWFGDANSWAYKNDSYHETCAIVDAVRHYDLFQLPPGMSVTLPETSWDPNYSLYNAILLLGLLPNDPQVQAKLQEQGSSLRIRNDEVEVNIELQVYSTSQVVSKILEALRTRIRNKNYAFKNVIIAHEFHYNLQQKQCFRRICADLGINVLAMINCDTAIASDPYLRITGAREKTNFLVLNLGYNYRRSAISVIQFERKGRETQVNVKAKEEFYYFFNTRRNALMLNLAELMCTQLSIQFAPTTNVNQAEWRLAQVSHRVALKLYTENSAGLTATLPCSVLFPFHPLLKEKLGATRAGQITMNIVKNHYDRIYPVELEEYDRKIRGLLQRSEIEMSQIHGIILVDISKANPVASSLVQPILTAQPDCQVYEVKYWEHEVIYTALRLRSAMKAGSMNVSPADDSTAPAIGIDVGTSSCTVAYFTKNNFAGFHDSSSNSTLSCAASVAVDRSGDQIAVAEKARALAPSSNSSSIFDLKRMIGRNFSRELERSWPFKILDINNGISIQVGDSTFSPEDLLGRIISHMKGCVEDNLGVPVTSAVLCVPKFFNYKQRALMEAACTRSGLKVLRLVNESTAAALAYTVTVMQEAVTGTDHFLVFDLGGSTLNVAVTELQSKQIRIKAIRENSSLGGEDFDREIFDHCTKEFKARHGVDLTVKNSDESDIEVAKRLAKLRIACEKGKIDLSLKDSVKICCQRIHGLSDMNITISRTQFEEMIEKYLEECLNLVNDVIWSSGLTVQDIRKVVLVGASTKIPIVQNTLGTKFGEDKVVKDILVPETAVAQGAAILANCLENPDRDNVTILLDV